MVAGLASLGYLHKPLNKMCANDWCWLNTWVVRVEQYDLTEYSGKTNNNFLHIMHITIWNTVHLWIFTWSKQQSGRSGFVCFSLHALTYEVCCYIVAVFWGHDDGTHKTTNKFHNEWKRNKNQRTLSGFFLHWETMSKPLAPLTVGQSNLKKNKNTF